ncbi:GFA family protein [Sphingomonas sp. BN140010]|uniref:GFA family protein n=1 Tax=Sphingomonas arvum TaxID=2992113 RepID=A0ABT3JDC3_9SPHN|nr:GFA family protein [Sphingomonas sp. BN140010]MCW3797041.1 GFA family protein [Sphingomonas sp. BN140010]
MAAARTLTGGCACGRIRFTADVPDDAHAYLCHCRMCQRASGNVSLAMVGLRQADVRWSQEPDWYDSSPIAQRPFCATCGTSLGFRYREGTDKMDLTVAAFDDPSGFKPSSHFGAESIHRAWLNTEGLPETRSDEYQALNERWSAAGAKPPA